ncbi:uncharacterized protein JCM10292_001082 [Rhodotorula paludigena]|uniref:uncharacterized protein n=1 Tax=Rhodotorula paludigena TaxID=86838 RepID=UPI003176F2A8
MGQGQSQQRTEPPAPADDASSPPTPPRPDETDSGMNTTEQGLPAFQDDARTTSDLPVEPAAPSESPAGPALVQDGADSEKVPAAPAPASTAVRDAASPSTTLNALPADIEHILSLGANDPDEAERVRALAGEASSRGELEQVVRELKEKALAAGGAEEVRMADAGQDELRKVEDEMREKGVQRGVEVQEATEEGEMLEEGGAEQKSKYKDVKGEDVKMDHDASSDSDSDSSSSSDESDSATAPAPATRQRGRGRGKQRAVDSDADDDDESGVTSSKTAPKTEHELAEPDISPLTVQQFEEGTELAKFGKVESLIENVVVIKADTSGDWRVLDEGTLVCWEDRVVIGAIFETFGSVQQPFYSLRFPAASPPDPTVFAISRPVFYSPNAASFVFTRDLRHFKGSDASNIWDEEVGAGEIEFSDDEEEAEYRRKLKADRRARTQSATPGPSRAPPARALAPSSALPPAHLPARPAVSYADTADDFLTPSLPTSRPMSGPRAEMGEKPPPGRVGRRMFERDTGATLEEGEEVEFEFSSGEGSEGEGDDDEMQRDEQRGFGAAHGRGDFGARGRGGARGGAGRGGPRGGAPGGRGRGRGRGGAAGATTTSPGGRPVRGLPRGRVPSGPSGLPNKPAFQADGGGDTEMSGRMAGGASPSAPPPAAGAAFSFGAGAPPPGTFAFGSTAGNGPSAARSPPQPHARGPPPSMPWSAAPPPAGSAYQQLPSYASGPAAAVYGYRAPPQQPAAPYYPSAPAPGYGSYGAPHPSAAGGGGGGYSPHQPYAAVPPSHTASGGGSPYSRATPGPAGPAAGASEGYNPIAAPGGGHINPRFLAAQQAAQQQQQQQQQQGYYGAGQGAYGRAYPPPGGPGGGQGQGQGRW